MVVIIRRRRQGPSRLVRQKLDTQSADRTYKFNSTPLGQVQESSPIVYAVGQKTAHPELKNTEYETETRFERCSTTGRFAKQMVSIWVWLRYRKTLEEDCLSDESNEGAFYRRRNKWTKKFGRRLGTKISVVPKADIPSSEPLDDPFEITASREERFLNSKFAQHLLWQQARGTQEPLEIPRGRSYLYSWYMATYDAANRLPPVYPIDQGDSVVDTPTKEINGRRFFPLRNPDLIVPVNTEGEDSRLVKKEVGKRRNAKTVKRKPVIEDDPDTFNFLLYASSRERDHEPHTPQHQVRHRFYHMRTLDQEIHHSDILSSTMTTPEYYTCREDFDSEEDEERPENGGYVTGQEFYGGAGHVGRSDIGSHAPAQPSIRPLGGGDSYFEQWPSMKVVRESENNINTTMPAVQFAAEYSSKLSPLAVDEDQSDANDRDEKFDIYCRRFVVEVDEIYHRLRKSCGVGLQWFLVRPGPDLMAAVSVF